MRFFDMCLNLMKICMDEIMLGRKTSITKKGCRKNVQTKKYRQKHARTKIVYEKTQTKIWVDEKYRRMCDKKH